MLIKRKVKYRKGKISGVHLADEINKAFAIISQPYADSKNLDTLLTKALQDMAVVARQRDLAREELKECQRVAKNLGEWNEYLRKTITRYLNNKANMKDLKWALTGWKK